MKVERREQRAVAVAEPWRAKEGGGGDTGAGGRVGAGGGGDRESLRWEKAEMVRGGELNIQQLCPDLLTRCFHALNVPPEADRKMAQKSRTSLLCDRVCVRACMCAAFLCK